VTPSVAALGDTNLSDATAHVSDTECVGMYTTAQKYFRNLFWMSDMSEWIFVQDLGQTTDIL